MSGLPARQEGTGMVEGGGGDTASQGEITPPPSMFRETGDGDSVSQPNEKPGTKENQGGLDLDKDIDVVLQENLNRGHLDPDTSVTIDYLPMDATLTSQDGQAEMEEHDVIAHPIDSFDFTAPEPERGAQRLEIPDGSERSFTSTSDSSVLAQKVVEHVIHKVALMMPIQSDDNAVEDDNGAEGDGNKLDSSQKAESDTAGSLGKYSRNFEENAQMGDTDMGGFLDKDSQNSEEIAQKGDTDMGGSLDKNSQNDVETVSNRTDTELLVTDIESPTTESAEGDVKVGLFQYYDDTIEMGRDSPEVTELDDEIENDVVEDQVESITDSERENILQLYGLSEDVVILEPERQRKDSSSDSDNNSLNARKGEDEEMVLDIQRDVYLPQTRLFSVTRDLSSAESSPRVDYVMTPSDHQHLSPVDQYHTTVETPDPADKNWPDRVDDDGQPMTISGLGHADGLADDEDMMLCGRPMSVDKSPALMQYGSVKENGKFRIVKIPVEGGGSTYTTIRVGGEQSPQQESPREQGSQWSGGNGSTSVGSGSEVKDCGKDEDRAGSVDMNVSEVAVNGGGGHVAKEEVDWDGTGNMGDLGAKNLDKNGAELPEMECLTGDVKHTDHIYNANTGRYDVNMEVSYANRDSEADCVPRLDESLNSRQSSEQYINGYVEQEETYSQPSQPHQENMPQKLSLSELRSSPVDQHSSDMPIKYLVTDNNGHESRRTGPAPFSLPNPLSLEQPVRELSYRTERLGRSLQNMEHEVSGLLPSAYEDELIRSAYDRVYQQKGQLVPRLTRSTGSRSHDSMPITGRSRSYDSVPIPGASQSLDSRRNNGVAHSTGTGDMPGAGRSSDTRSHDTGPIPGYKTLQEQQARWSSTFDMLEDQHRRELRSQYEKHQTNIQHMQQQMEQELQKQHLSIRRKIDIHKGALAGGLPERDTARGSLDRDAGISDRVPLQRDTDRGSLDRDARFSDRVPPERDTARGSMERDGGLRDRVPPERDTARGSMERDGGLRDRVPPERDTARGSMERDGGLPYRVSPERLTGSGKRDKLLSPEHDTTRVPPERLDRAERRSGSTHDGTLSQARDRAHQGMETPERDVVNLHPERDGARRERMSPERDTTNMRRFVSPDGRSEPSLDRIYASPDIRSPARGHRTPDRSRSSERSQSLRERSNERSYHGRRRSSEISVTTRDSEPTGAPVSLPFTESKSWREIYQEVRAEEDEKDTPKAPPLDDDLADFERSRPHQSPISRRDLQHSPVAIDDTVAMRDDRQSRSSHRPVSPLHLGDDVTPSSVELVPTSDTVSPHVQELLDTLQEGRSSLRGIHAQGPQSEGTVRPDMPRAGVYSSPMPMLRGKGKGSKPDKTSKRSLDLSTSHDSTRHYDDTSTTRQESTRHYDDTSTIGQESTRLYDTSTTQLESTRQYDTSTSQLESTLHYDTSTNQHDSKRQFDSSYTDHSGLSVSQDRRRRHRSSERRSRDSHRHDNSDLSASLRVSLREKHAKHLADLRSYYEEELRELRTALSDSLGVGSVGGRGEAVGGRGETSPGARSAVETPLLEAENRHLGEKCTAMEDEVEDQYQRIQELEQKNVGIEKRASEYSAAFAESQALGIQNRAHIDELQRCLRERDDLVNDLEAKLLTQQDNAKIYKKSLDEEMELHRHDKISLQRIIDKYESMEREHKLLQNTMDSTENKLYDTRSEVVEMTRTVSKLELENKRLGRENDNLHHKVTQSLNLSSLHESFGSPSSPRGPVERRGVRPASPVAVPPLVAPMPDTRIASFTSSAPRDPPPSKDHGPAPTRHSRSTGTDLSQAGRSKTSAAKSTSAPKERKETKSKKFSEPRDSSRGRQSSRDTVNTVNTRETASQRSRSQHSERSTSHERASTRDVTPPRPPPSDSPPGPDSADYSPLIKAERELYKLRDMMRQAVAVKPATSPPHEPKLQTKFYGSERPSCKDDYTPDLGPSRGKREKPTPSGHASVAKTKTSQSKSDRNQEKSGRKPSSKSDRSSKSKDKAGTDRRDRDKDKDGEKYRNRDKGRERDKDTDSRRHRDGSRHRDRTPSRSDRDRTPTRTDNKDDQKFSSVNPDEYNSPTRFDISISADSKSKTLIVTQKSATQSAKLKDSFPSEIEKQSEYPSHDQYSRSYDQYSRSHDQHSRSHDQHSRPHDQHSKSHDQHSNQPVRTHDQHSKSHDQPVRTHDQGTETVEATMERVRSGGYLTRPQWEDVYTSMAKPAPDKQPKVQPMSMEDKIKERLRSISDMEHKYDGLQAEKRQLESGITKIPLQGRVDRNKRQQKEQMEDRLDVVEKELGSLRMSLKRCNVLKTSG